MLGLSAAFAVIAISASFAACYVYSQEGKVRTELIAALALWAAAVISYRASGGNWKWSDLLLGVGLVVLLIALFERKGAVGAFFPAFFTWLSFTVWAWMWHLPLHDKLTASALAALVALASRGPAYAFDRR